jgi:serine/threonine-protein phosphatase 2A activator
MTPSWINQISEVTKYEHELTTYFSHSFGDRQRIDYGSGHELNFVMFLYHPSIQNSCL